MFGVEGWRICKRGRWWLRDVIRGGKFGYVKKKGSGK